MPAPSIWSSATRVTTISTNAFLAACRRSSCRRKARKWTTSCCARVSRRARGFRLPCGSAIRSASMHTITRALSPDFAAQVRQRAARLSFRNGATQAAQLVAEAARAWRVGLSLVDRRCRGCKHYRRPSGEGDLSAGASWRTGDHLRMTSARLARPVVIVALRVGAAQACCRPAAARTRCRAWRMRRKAAATAGRRRAPSRDRAAPAECRAPRRRKRAARRTDRAGRASARCAPRRRRRSAVASAGRWWHAGPVPAGSLRCDWFGLGSGWASSTIRPP